MSFETKTLPEQIAGIIAENLQNATTEDEIKRAFEFETMPVVEPVDSVKLLADAINRAVEKLEVSEVQNAG